MKVVRSLPLVVGVGFGSWGVWLMSDFTPGQLVSMGTWLVGGVIVHDAVIAPITVVLGVLAARVLPGHVRAVAAVAFLIWATLTVTFINVLSGQGGKPGNDTVLNRPYGMSWVVLTVVIVVIASVVARRRRPPA